MSIITIPPEISLDEQRRAQCRGFELSEDSSWSAVTSAALNRPDDAFYSFGIWLATLTLVYGEEFAAQPLS